MQNDHGDTALHNLARRDGSSGSAAVALFLLNNGADPRVTNSKGSTAWDVACEQKNWDVISGFMRQEADLGIQYTNLFFEEVRINVRFGFRDESRVIFGNSMGRVNRQLYAIARSLSTRVKGLEAGEVEQAPNGHVPAEHIDMLFRNLFGNHETRSFKIFKGILNYVRRDFLENHEAPPHRRAREPSCIIQAMNDTINIEDEPKEFISLVMPFIYVADWTIIDERKDDYVEQTQDLKYCIGNSHELIEVHMLLTLDEYCSPALSQDVLNFRNKDQVLGRYERSTEKKEDTATMLSENYEGDNLALLGGLWLLVKLCVWKLGRLFDPETWQRLWHQQPVNTAEKSNRLPRHAVFIGQAWVWKICREFIIALPPEVSKEILQIESNWNTGVLLATLSLNRLIELLDDPAHPLLKTYENALSIISEEVNHYAKSALIEDIDIEQEKEFFHWISDLREELSMVKSVLAEQEEVWKEFMKSEWPNQEPKELWRPQTKFHKYRRRVAKLEEDAGGVKRNIATKLDLKQKHAAIMSASVFGFTVITVIFTPLSFVAALFALPIDEFDKGKEGNNKDGVYLSKYIGKWVTVTESVSIFITLVAMWAALRFGMGVHVWGKKGVREWVRKKADTIRTLERHSRHTSGDAIVEKGGLSKDGTPRHGGRKIVRGLMKGLKRSGRNRSDGDESSDLELGGSVEPASVLSG
ncbi:hypothetical protein GGR58DRAFT_67127 [Xylaria digitata]|nr:hypothetical protein GGR58DRAFT_67127 [Xylaria digitata]